MAIRNLVWRHRGADSLTFDEKPIRDTETYEEYLKRISSGVIQPAGSGDRWSPSEEHSLNEMVDNDATQVELAEAFPNRKWWRIRHKIKLLRGTGVKIREVGLIKRNETITDYYERTGNDSYQYAVSLEGATNPMDYRDGSHGL